MGRWDGSGSFLLHIEKQVSPNNGTFIPYNTYNISWRLIVIDLGTMELDLVNSRQILFYHILAQQCVLGEEVKQNYEIPSLREALQ